MTDRERDVLEAMPERGLVLVDALIESVVMARGLTSKTVWGAICSLSCSGAIKTFTRGGHMFCERDGSYSPDCP